MSDHSQTVIITGAGSGIGQACALRFAQAGWSVLSADLNPEGLARTAELAADLPGAVATLCADVTQMDAADRIIGKALERFGGVTCLVNNAGIGKSSPAHETTDEDWDRFLSINQTAPFRLSREVIKHLPKGSGSIVNIASIAGITALVNSAPYSATKAALMGLTRQMATDYGHQGIRVNAVAPGLIESPLTRERIETDPRFYEFNIDPIPFSRLGKVEDIANAVFFLASDEAGFINGHTLVVDGGLTQSSFSRRGAEM